jgi:cytoskeletal protein CcmA (bactofilin family)
MAKASKSGDVAVLGQGLRVRGRVRGDGDLRIEAQVEGDVSVSGALELGEGSRVQGAVSASSVAIAGELEGDIEAQGAVSIGATGALRGDVVAGEITLEEGGRFHGTIQADFDLPKAIA